MGPFLLKVVLLLWARTNIAAYAQTHPDFTTYVADAAVAHQVPEVVLLSVGFHESGLGSNPHTAHPWGALSPSVRAYCGRADTRCTGTPLHDQIETSAHVLRVGFEACRSWTGSLRRYYSGSCRMQRPHLSHRDARSRSKRHQFYRVLASYEHTVSYSDRVTHTAARLLARAREADTTSAAALLPWTHR